MKKKILVMLLSLSLLSLAAGCSASKAEPENVASGGEEQPEADVSEPEDTEESAQKEPDTSREKADEKEEISAVPENAQTENASKIPLENGQPDGNSTAVMYYEFKKDYENDAATVSGTLEFKIPQLTMRSVEAGMINEDILEYFEEQLEEMEDMVEDFSEQWDFEEEDPDLSIQYTLGIDYELTYLDENKICILLKGYEYSSGAAHGMPFRKPLIYDLESGERMDAEDLFAVSEDKFASAFIAAFKNHMAESPDDYWEDAMDYVKEDASFENEAFYLTESGTVFYFEPYVLAAYSFGYIEAEIPYDSVPLK